MYLYGFVNAKHPGRECNKTEQEAQALGRADPSAFLAVSFDYDRDAPHVHPAPWRRRL
jgi:hypothetical protein